jgi:hypothetical protein
MRFVTKLFFQTFLLTTPWPPLLRGIKGEGDGAGGLYQKKLSGIEKFHHNTTFSVI